MEVRQRTYEVLCDWTHSWLVTERPLGSPLSDRKVWETFRLPKHKARMVKYVGHQHALFDVAVDFELKH